MILTASVRSLLLWHNKETIFTRKKKGHSDCFQHDAAEVIQQEQRGCAQFRWPCRYAKHINDAENFCRKHNDDTCNQTSQNIVQGKFFN